MRHGSGTGYSICCDKAGRNCVLCQWCHVAAHVAPQKSQFQSFVLQVNMAADTWHACVIFRSFLIAPACCVHLDVSHQLHESAVLIVNFSIMHFEERHRFILNRTRCLLVAMKHDDESRLGAWQVLSNRVMHHANLPRQNIFKICQSRIF